MALDHRHRDPTLRCADVRQNLRHVEAAPTHLDIFIRNLDGHGHPGTVFLHKDRFSRGKGAFTPIDYKPPAEVTDADYPMFLSTGRAFMHYHSGSMTRVSPSLNQEGPEGYVEISPVDAKDMAIKDGERVKVSSRRGEIQIKARISGKVNRGVVFIPFHFAETVANVLTNSAYDPVAKIPEYKVCAVKVEKLAA